MRRIGGILALALVAAGCGPAQRGGLSADGDRDVFRPFVFVQAGDPQIGGIAGVRRSQQRLLTLAERVREIRPAFVVCVGDLVNDGDDAEQIAAFDEALGKFDVPFRMIPGNHDDPAIYREKYGPDRYSFVQNNCEFVCINSNLLGEIIRNRDERQAADEQWDWLERTLAEARRRNRTHVVLVMHHPPPTLVHGRRRLDELLARHDVKVVLSGHIHITREFERDGYVCYTVGGTGWVGDRSGHGYRVFEVREDGIRQQYVRLETPVEDIPLEVP